MTSGKLIGTESGECIFGKYGGSIYSNEKFKRIFIWWLSNGKDYLVATYICDAIPEQEELNEVQRMVKEMDINVKNKSCCKFWK